MVPTAGVGLGTLPVSEIQRSGALKGVASGGFGGFSRVLREGSGGSLVLPNWMSLNISHVTQCCRAGNRASGLDFPPHMATAASNKTVRRRRFHRTDCNYQYNKVVFIVDDNKFSYKRGSAIVYDNEPKLNMK